MKKHLIIIVALLSLCVSSFAQGYVYFGYDANGNRINRDIYFGKTAENGRSLESEEELASVALDKINEMEVKLYPNPTQGHFSLSVNSVNNETTMHVILLTSTGEVLYNKTLCSTVEDIDLSDQPAGIYLLKLEVDNETQAWKVVKQ